MKVSLYIRCTFNDLCNFYNRIKNKKGIINNVHVESNVQIFFFLLSNDDNCTLFLLGLVFCLSATIYQSPNLNYAGFLF